MTLHGSKGLEFPVVFLAGLNAGTLPYEHAYDAGNREEERRLFLRGHNQGARGACLELIGKAVLLCCGVAGDCCEGKRFGQTLCPASGANQFV